MASQLFDVDAEQLIKLVKDRPVLWDRKHEKYRDKFKTQKAWQEIYVELNENFENLDDHVRNEFGRIVLKKWTQMRDSYRKSLSKQRSGCGASKVKTYIYSSQLRFLENMFEERASGNTSSENIEDPNERSEMDEIHQKSVSNRTNDESAGKKERLLEEQFKKPVPKKRKMSAAESDMIDASCETSNRHLHFFSGLLPSLEKFDDFDTLDFQMEVLKLVKDIRLRKKPVSFAAVSANQPLNNRNQIHNLNNRQFHEAPGRFLSQPSSVYASPSASNDSSDYSLFNFKEE